LYRGLAEGLTHGADFVSAFPAGFLTFGQGTIAGLPTQVLLLAAVATAYAVLLHRSISGRAAFAIGWSPDGARFAGIPVARRLAFLYIASGAVAALAAVLYVARTGQAKADAGTGYELLAVAAVVLGGTSIFGGHGTVHGTLLGVAALAVLRNGLQLSDQPGELAGILTGALLLAVLMGEAALKKISARRA